MGRTTYIEQCGQHHIWVGVAWSVVQDNGYECVYDVRTDEAVFYRDLYGWQHECRDDPVSELFDRLRTHFDDDEVPMEKLGTWTDSMDAYLCTKARRFRAQFQTRAFDHDVLDRAEDVTDQYHRSPKSDSAPVRMLPFPCHLLPKAKEMLETHHVHNEEEEKARLLSMQSFIFLSGGLAPPTPYNPDRLTLDVEAFPDDIWTGESYGEDFVWGAANSELLEAIA